MPPLTPAPRPIALSAPLPPPLPPSPSPGGPGASPSVGAAGLSVGRGPQAQGGVPRLRAASPQPGARAPHGAHAFRPAEELGDREHRLRHALRPGRAGGDRGGGLGGLWGAGLGRCPHGSQPLPPPQELPCSGRRCLGSLVLPKQLPAPGNEGTRSGPELLALARDFINQYYASIRR